MADRGAAGERPHHLVAVEIAGDMAHRPVGVEMGAVEAGDSRRFLAAVLERVQAERDEACGILDTPDAENPAFLAQLVVIERMSRKHVPALGTLKLEASYRVAGGLCRPLLERFETGDGRKGWNATGGY